MPRDEYSHRWKAEHGYYHPDGRWFDDELCEYYEEEKARWREGRRLPTTEYEWKLVMGLIAPEEKAKRVDKDELRRRIDLIEFFEQFTKLRVTGDKAVGKCPLHEDGSPSFSVDRKKAVWHCFGCGEGGDVFAFLMRKYDKSFREAVEIAAEIV